MTAAVPSPRIISRRAPLPVGALLLAVAGNIAVLVILAIAAVAMIAAAAAVFGPPIFAAL